MSISGNNILAGASGNQGYEIARSLRFNSGDTPYLSQTPSSGLDTKTWTISLWIKKISASGYVVRAGEFYLYFTSDQLHYYDYSGSANGVRLKTNAVFRDSSAWYHIVLANDTTQATATNRHRLYVNGDEVTSFATDSPAAQNATSYLFNSSNTINVGGGTASNYPDCYLAEVHFVHGSQLAPSNFGETDPVTGAWIPKQYSGSHGTGGSYLNFLDNSGVTATTLGKDSSGNGNNWTPVNFSVTAGAGNDSLEDTPTNNFCTMNALAKGTDATLSNGNLDVAYGSSSTRTATIATMGMSSGKWYWEHKLTSEGAEIFGIVNVSDDSPVSNYPGFSNNGWGIYGDDGNIYHNGSATAYGSAFATNDVIGCAFDADNGKIWWSKNGTFFNSGDPAAGTNAAFSSLASNTYYPAVGDGSATGTYTVSMNFGQRAFDYTPPTGFEALNTANLPVPTVKDGTEYFDSKLWTATGSDPLAITGLSFSPSLVWAKARNDGYNHVLVDQVRGVNNVLSSNLTNAESSITTVTQFNSDGFNAGGTANNNYSLNCTVSAARTYVAWNWKAGGSGSANTDGSISSTVSVNADAGFSIVSYTGNGTAGATIGHNLGVAPSMVIVKNRDAATDWSVWAKPVVDQYGAAYVVFLQATSSAGAYSGVFNSTAPTSTVFSVGTSSSTNTSSQDYVAYCFSEVEGYSKFGSYTGNGSTDGPFVYCGFRPAFVMVKSVTNTSFWQIEDAARGPTNEITNKALFPNSSLAESGAGAGYAVDFLSNGFKWRNTGANYNTSGQTYIFAAFAETPFKYTNAR